MKKIYIILCLFCLTSVLQAQNIYASFDVQAQKSANLAFNSSGIVNEIFVEIGSIVKKGQNLASLNNEDTKAMLNIQQTVLKFAKKDYKRQIKIKKIINKETFDKYESIYQNAQAQVLYQEKILEKTVLKAPFDGIIISKSIESGDLVSAQQAKTAFILQNLVKRKLILQFDQKYHNVVKIGSSFKYKLDGDDKTYTGKISKIYPFANNKTRKISAEVLTADFIVGLFGDGYIIIND